MRRGFCLFNDEDNVTSDRRHAYYFHIQVQLLTSFWMLTFYGLILTFLLREFCLIWMGVMLFPNLRIFFRNRNFQKCWMQVTRKKYISIHCSSVNIRSWCFFYPPSYPESLSVFIWHSCSFILLLFLIFLHRAQTSKSQRQETDTDLWKVSVCLF